MSCWKVLQIDATGDKREIKRAYARRLKVTHPEDDAATYQQLREAYDAALEEADYRAKYGDYDEWDEDEDDVEGNLKSEEAEKEKSALDNVAVIQDGVPVASSAGLDVAENELEVLQQSNVNREPGPASLELKGESAAEKLIVNDKDSENSQTEKHENQLGDKDTNLEITISAIEVIDSILQLASDESEAAAVKLFTEKVKSNDFVGLDEAYDFEGTLLVGLYNQKLMPQQFAEAVYEYYGWSIYDNQFKYSDDYRAYFEYVVCLIESRQTFNFMLKNLMPTYRSEECTRVRKALYTSYDEESLQKIADNTHKRKLADRIFTLALKHEAQYQIDEWYVGPLSNENVEWWEENVNFFDKKEIGVKARNDKDKYKEKDKAREEKRDTKIGCLIMIVGAFLLLKYCGNTALDFLLTTNNSDPQALIRALDTVTKFTKRHNENKDFNKYELGKVLKSLSNKEENKGKGLPGKEPPSTE